MKLKVVSDNPNYLARLVRIPAPRKHSNADRLQCVNILGNNLITGLNAKGGDLMVYFPLECSINVDYLAHSNSLDKPELNRDKTTKGFFSPKHGRVKALKLRSERSEGYLAPAHTVEEWSGYKFTESDIDTDFDFIGDLKICEKYVNREQLRKQEQEENRKKKGGKVKRESRLVDNQFRLHPDTKHLKREIKTIHPNDWVEITSKWHGANGVISKVLTKRKLSWIEKIAKKLGIKVVEAQYNLLFASRRVIKNEFADQKTCDYYDSNIWELVAKKYQDCLQDGITLYGEVVGYTPTGGAIQSMGGKAFDYGCEVGKCDFIVFRINYTSPSGNVYEFSLQQVVDYCNRFGLKHVPVYYIGQAKDLYRELYLDYVYNCNTEAFEAGGYEEEGEMPGNRDWHDKFLELLTKEYLEKDDIYCNTKGLPDEGIVLSKRVDVFEGLKLKSFRFLEGTSAQVDSGQEDIDDVN